MESSRGGECLALGLLPALGLMASLPSPSATAQSRGVTVEGIERTADGAKLPTLWAVVIGVNDCTDPGIPDLSAASRDAQRFGQFLEQQKALGIYRRVEVTTLIDGRAPREDLRSRPPTD